MITKCRVCSSSNLTEVLDLGHQYLSDFRFDEVKPPKFPLRLMLCANCTLAQLDTTVNRDLMYHDGYGYRSGVNEQIKSNLRSLVDYGLNENSSIASWLDIACNDGTLLSMVPKEIFRVGIDPVRKFKKESELHANQIISDFFPSKDIESEMKFDVITSISMFYDLDDPNSFVKEIKKRLTDTGIWIVQQNYLLSMLENNSFDNICHEHIEYYSLSSMKYLVESNGLEIFDVFLDDINGGSLVTAISHPGLRKVRPSVENQLIKEVQLLNSASWSSFRDRIEKIRNELVQTLTKIKEGGGRVQIYGASTRGATIWQFAGIDASFVEYAVERQTEKIGRFFSALGIKIISEEEMRGNPPEYLLIGPWFLGRSFIAREAKYLENGGKFIFPIPKVSIFQAKDFF